MVALVEPQLVDEYENAQAQRALKKSKSDRAAKHGGKTSNQTTSKGKSKAKEDASAEMKQKTSPGRQQRSESPTPGISYSTQIKTTNKGKSKAKVDAFSEMLKKTFPGKEQRPASPTPVSRSTQIKTYGKVIEVSSDSDSDSSLPSRIALPPLMAARARATTKPIPTTALAQPYKKAFGKILTHTLESEIIDLTQ